MTNSLLLNIAIEIVDLSIKGVMIFHSYVSLPEGNSNIQTDTWGFSPAKMEFSPAFGFRQAKTWERHKRRPGFHQPKSGEFSGPSVASIIKSLGCEASR